MTIALLSLGAAAPPALAAVGEGVARETIGRSLDGRPIAATLNGDPEAPLQVLVVGAVHGDEAAGRRVARRLLARSAPAGAAIRVVADLNPDGTAAGTRGNARGVDLNRNFPYDWRPLGGGEYSGTGALSEPESRAAWRLIRRVRPEITIWFHQPFGLVDRSSGGDRRIERRFAGLIGLPVVRLRGRYPGSASRWQNHAHPGETAFVVELPAVVSGALVDRAADAVLQLASEYASPGLEDAVSALPLAREPRSSPPASSRPGGRRPARG
jgi:protein MpaA